MRAMIAVSVAFAGWLAVLPCVAAPAVPTPTQASLRVDDRLRGLPIQWSSDADPAGALTIHRLAQGILEVRAPGRFAAVGFVLGWRFVGLACVPDVATAERDANRLALLWIQDLDRRPMVAEFADSLTVDFSRREAWMPLDSAPPPGADKAPSEVRDEPPPKFGEYVYVEELPEAVMKVSPVYPDEAREAGIDGTVMVQALVGKDGRVLDTRVVKSIPALDAAAVAAVVQWQFKPALSKGRPVAVWVTVPVKFSLH